MLKQLFFALLVCSALGCAHSSEGDPETTPAAVEAPPAPPEPAAPAASIETKEVTYSSGSTELKGFIAYPATTEKRPAVIVVHEWWGPNDYVRMRAKMLAELGYVGFAIDMYGNGKVATHPDDAKKFMTETMSNIDEAVKRYDAAKALISSDPRVDGSKLASIGYCFGGAVSLHMARIGTDLDAIASFHGNLATQKPMPRGVFGGKILIAQGAADPFVPKEQLDAFKKEMDAAGASYEVVEYPGAMHAFTNPAATEAGEKYKLPFKYDPAADAASWQKLTELLAATWK
jgi:dienelactone hydrolase